jgi:hypothetical protein
LTVLGPQPNSKEDAAGGLGVGNFGRFINVDTAGFKSGDDFGGIPGNIRIDFIFVGL